MCCLNISWYEDLKLQRPLTFHLHVAPIRKGKDAQGTLVLIPCTGLYVYSLFSKVYLVYLFCLKTVVYLWKRKYLYFVYETFVMKLSRLVWKCSCSHLQGVESYSIISWLPSRSIFSLTYLYPFTEQIKFLPYLT